MSEQIHVLAVEDNPGDVDLILETLPATGRASFAIESVSRLAEAVARLGRGGIDLVLLDLGLPDSGGLDTLHKVRRVAPTAPIIVLTGNSDEETAIAAVREGAQDYLIKGQFTGNLLVRAARYAVERQRAEAAVQRERKRFDDILENLPTMICLVAPDYHMPFANRYFREHFGELPGRRCFESIFHRTEPCPECPSFTPLKIHTPHHREWVAPDGSYIDVSDFPFTDVDGSPLILEIGFDVTKRVRTSERLRESLSLYHSLVENLPQHILRKDLEGRFTFANQHFCRSLGKSLDEIEGKTDFDMYPPELARKYQDDDKRVVETGENFETVEEHEMPGGKRIWVEVVKTPLRDTFGNIVGLQGIFRDVTERILAQEKIGEQARLIDPARDAITVSGLDGEIRFWNQGAERLPGWSAQEAIGRKIADLVFPECARFEMAQRALIEKGEWNGELRMFSKAGEQITVGSHWTLLQDEQGNGRSVMSISSDITEKKSIEAQLQRSQRLESIGTLASGLAHDLNNILSPIMMSVSLLREDPSPAEREDILAMVEKNAQRGAEIIKQLLTFGRGLSGVQGALQLRHLIKDVVRIAEETFPKNIKIKFKAPADLWPLIGDVTQLHQVVLNLCLNSRDAMPRGGILSLIAENIQLDEECASMNPWAKAGPYARLQVSDTGCGIAPENLDRVFVPFFTTKAPGQGTGLGLAMVLGIVKSHGGFVDVCSEVGRGTTFKIYIPAAREASPVAGDVVSTPLPRGRRELILVVDDEDSICYALQNSLERQGYRTLIARNGAEAIALYGQNRTAIKVVVTDLLMPVVDGITLIRALKKMNPRVKIIASSGLESGVNESLRQDLKDLGVGKFLSKPYRPADLLRALQEQLGH